MLKNIVTFLSGHKYIVGISFLLIAAYLVFINPDSISVGNNSIGNRELPIYSVDTPQKNPNFVSVTPSMGDCFQF